MLGHGSLTTRRRAPPPPPDCSLPISTGWRKFRARYCARIDEKDISSAGRVVAAREGDGQDKSVMGGKEKRQRAFSVDQWCEM